MAYGGWVAYDKALEGETMYCWGWGVCGGGVAVVVEAAAV